MEVTEDPSADSSTSDSSTSDDSSASESSTSSSSSSDGTYTASSSRALTAYLSDDGISTTADESDTTTLKYFPVTMYDYDSDTINAAMHQAEVDEALASGTTLTQWNGLYFSSGNPGTTASYTYDLDEETTSIAWVTVSLDDIDSSSTYVIVGYRGQALTGTTSSITGTATGTSAGANIDEDSTVMSSATAWTITKTSSGYTISATISGSTRYITIGSGTGTTSTSAATLTITETNYGDNSVSIGQTSSSSYPGASSTTYYLNQNGGSSGTTYTGYGTNGNSDDGSRFYIYKLDTVTTSTASTGALNYANWNYYTGNSLAYTGYSTTGTGNWLYSGIASSTLDSLGNIQFVASSAASILFDSDSSVKTIYTNVEMPFVYDSDSSTYTFDSAQYGVYFNEDSTQGSTSAQSNGRLYWTETTQKLDNDKKTTVETVWAPYDATENVGSGQNGSSYDTMNYHFGMKATIPFTMTTTGKLNDADATSNDIVFSFSGDDDVWVYIDGTEVIDLGGIKNRLSATINFAENTVTVTAADNGYSSAGTIGDANEDTTTNLVANGWTYTSNGTSSTYTHALFNDDDSTGLINMTRETFAASSSHELSVFYLERGAGSSNCKIEFNLPIYDYVSVTKNITQSITSDGEISDLTDEEQAVIDNVSFGFTLYHDGEVVSGATYSILNVDGQAVGTGTTDSNGHFTLQNGQTARFTTQFDSDDTWYVVEDEKTGYSTSPGWSYTSTGVNAATETAAEDGLTSDKVHIVGGDESEDSIHFTCNNYLSVTIPNPGILTEDEEIVIDYGLSVEIDILSNDLYRADEVTVYGIEAYDSSKTYAGGSGDDNSTTATTDGSDTAKGTYGTATLNSDGTITYQLTSQMTGVEVLVYEVKLTGSETDAAGTTATKTVYGTGKVYIIPATIMYYEEDFGLVTFKTSTSYTGDGWTTVGTAQTDSQEPGVVGTLTDSTYGSDVAYLNDGEDSNGTSKYINTTSGAAQFTYTFTGTGTTFFARTTNDSATISVTVTDSSGNTVYQLVRDTSYKNWENYTPSSTSTNYSTLYNIPVFTWTASDYGYSYGTYTVTATVYKADSGAGRGSEFWLDGIRITNPLNEDDTYASIANSAYATDGESGMTYVTLREKLLTEATYLDYSENEEGVLTWSDDGFVVFTDTDGTVDTADTYQSDGPKEEVYLAKGQSVTFSLANWDADAYDLYLGMKAPTGSGTVTVGSTSISVNNATDCYYEISDYGIISTSTDGTKVVTFTITATSDAIISLTNIKVTGNADFVIVAQEDEDVNDSIGEASVGAEMLDTASITSIDIESYDLSDEEADALEALINGEETEGESAEAATEAETEETETSDSASEDRNEVLDADTGTEESSSDIETESTEASAEEDVVEETTESSVEEITITVSGESDAEEAATEAEVVVPDNDEILEVIE